MIDGVCVLGIVVDERNYKLYIYTCIIGIIGVIWRKRVRLVGMTP